MISPKSPNPIKLREILAKSSKSYEIKGNFGEIAEIV